MSINEGRFANGFKPLGIFTILMIAVLVGCAAQPITNVGLDRAALREENIQRLAVLVFESPQDDPQAGSHISKLLEVNLLKTGLYRIAERGEIEKVLKERGFGAVSSSEQSVNTIVSIWVSPPAWCRSKPAS